MSIYGTYDAIRLLHSVNRDGAVATEVYLEATGTASAGGYFGDAFIWTQYWPAQVKAFGLRVTTTINYDTLVTAAVYALHKRPAPGDTSNSVEVVRLTIPNGMAAGSVVYAIPPTYSEARCSPGDQLAFKIVTAGAGGGSIAGEVEPFVMLTHWVETSANLAVPSDWVKDTTTQV